jgi:signal transduction histidine kinase/ActR/RegA family two-component response regulator
VSPLRWARRSGSPATDALAPESSPPPRARVPDGAAERPGIEEAILPPQAREAGPAGVRPAAGVRVAAGAVSPGGDDPLARLHRQTQRLVRTNLALVRQLRPAGAVQWAVNDVRTVVDAAYAGLLLRDGPSGATGTFVHSGLARGAQASIASGPPQARGLLGVAMKARRPMRLTDLRQHPEFSGFPEGHPEMTSFVSAPVLRRREVIGVLFATGKRRAPEFTRDDQRFVARVAAELGRSRMLSAEAEPPELVDRIAASSRALRKEMETTRAFLSNLSHELRGSIAGIMTSAELLSDPSLGAITDDQMHALGGRIHSVAANLLTLVDNLFDLGRLEAGRLEAQLQPVDLAAVVEDAAAVVSPLADRSGVELGWPALGGLPRVLADPVRLRQVLVNLLVNAVKFTPPRGRAWLEVEVTSTGLRLAVCDTGRGIRAEDTERIFEPFERAADARIPGVGLGLAICRHIVDLHGSDLEVSTKLGEGSRFSFDLRRSREPLPPRLLRSRGGEKVAEGHDGAAASVLVVEDDPVSRQSVSDVLSGAGYRVYTAASREGALETIATVSPDIVLLDVQLPDGNGLEVVGSLRGAVQHPLVVLALSADRLGNTAEMARVAGCDYFALKPMPAHDLLTLMVRAVEARRAAAAQPGGIDQVSPSAVSTTEAGRAVTP